MELLTLKIKPLSAFATLPKGDTIFGQIVAYDFLDKKDIFKDYLQSEPKLIISDMMPLGMFINQLYQLSVLNLQMKLK